MSRSGGTSGAPASERISWILAFMGVAVALFLAWRSRNWPLVHDQVIMHYIAWLITQGLVPYRDIFDMNLPGVYLLHLGFWNLFGPSDHAWRLFDLSWTAMTCALVYVYCRGMIDRWSATSAAALFAVYHLSDGAAQAGQRDLLIAGLLLAAAYCVVRFSETGRSRFLWCSGGAVGAALAIKPLPGLFWLACAGVAGYGAKRLGQSMSRAILIVLGAGVILPGIALAWVWWMGGLPAFISVQKDYVLPLYARTGRGSLWGALSFAFYQGVPLLELGLRDFRAARFAAAIAIIVAGVGLLCVLRHSWTLRHSVGALGIAYGVVHFLLQGKFFPYHLYPLVVFMCVLVATVLASAGEKGSARLQDKWRTGIGWGYATLVVYGIFIAGLGIRGVTGTKGLTTFNDISGAGIVRDVDSIARDLAGVVPAGAMVQSLDAHNLTIHALLKLGIREPSRFLYEFHFFHDIDDPRIRMLRAELIADLTRHRPAAIVVAVNDRWLAEFSELRSLLSRSYDQAIVRSNYRIYTLRLVADSESSDGSTLPLKTAIGVSVDRGWSNLVRHNDR